jgi:hypothetical protein
MRFARWVFTAAGIYGFICLTPFFFIEHQIAAPAARLDHPEYFYGFLLVAIAFQIAFLIIARDPVRLRPMMIAAVIEKLPFGLAVPLLWAQGRVAAMPVVFSTLDIVWGVLFAIAWLRTPKG